MIVPLPIHGRRQRPLSPPTAGTPTRVATYAPFGTQVETVLVPLSPAESKGWIGERFDPETGLTYLNARYYDAALGRFLSPDWWSQDDPGAGTNRYAYAFNEPINGSDPNGHDSVWCKTGQGPIPCSDIHPLIDPTIDFLNLPSNLALNAAGSAGESIAPYQDLIDGVAMSAGPLGAPAGKASGALGAFGGFIRTAREANLLKAGSAAGKVDDVVGAGKALGVTVGGEASSLRPFYPVNNGFLGTQKKQYLMPGQTIDRFGGSGYSRFFSPTGTSEVARALPPGTAGMPLRRFEVMKPFEVDAGVIAPWFGQPGGGTQFRSPVPLETLLSRGIVREVP